jgi:hypothetical protein
LPRCTGVRISNQKLVIATVERHANAALELRPDACAVLELGGRAQDDLLSLFADVASFVKKSGIESLVVKGSPVQGTHRWSGLGFKIEAVLQLLPRLWVKVVPAVTITSWAQRVEPELPKPNGAELGYAISKLQADAICTAAWGEQQLQQLNEQLTCPG